MANIGFETTDIITRYLQVCDDTIGDNYVLRNQEELSRYSHNCEGDFASVRAVLQPSNTRELQEVIRAAKGIPICFHTVSTGLNWGYGAATPAGVDQIVLDLRRMNRIREVNTDLAFATIEPGVTQAQLCAYLQLHELPLLMDVTSSSPHSSVLANTLERGFGHSPFADRFAHASNFQVLLPDGSIITTGMGRFESARAASVYRWGLGPFLDGLFSQSDFGIVVSASVALLPKPDVIRAILFEFGSWELLLKAISVIRDLRVRGVLQGGVHIANSARLATVSAGRTLPTSWSLFTGAWGSQRQVEFVEEEVRTLLGPYGSFHSVSALSEEVAEAQHPFLQNTEILGFLRGQPSMLAVQGTYVQAGKSPETMVEPVHDGLGIIWFAPVLPLLEEDFVVLHDMVTTLLKRYGYPLNVNFTTVSQKACCATIGIFFDRDDVSAAKNAHSCYRELVETCLTAGYPPYRSGSRLRPARKLLYSDLDPHVRFCRQLRSAIDPSGIFSSGKYDI